MKPNIYKLQYDTKELAIADLKLKKVLTEEGEYAQPYTEEVDGEIIEHNERTHSVVHLGSIVLTPAIYDSEGIETTPAVLSEFHHLDVMTDLDIDFGDNLVIIPEGEPSAHKWL